MADTGDSIIAKNARWTFGGEVCENFDVHAVKSIPLYESGHDLVVKISDYFLIEDSLCYELGCSTGRLLQRMAVHNAGKKTRFIGIDIEPNMVKTARDNCSDFPNVEVLVGDLTEIKLESCDLIVAYYTVQFIQPRYRQILFDMIFNALNWGGAFLLFEKVRAPDARFQDLSTGIYTDFKIDQGYSHEEILAKTRSLKGILEPFSTQGNLDLLSRAGFQDVMTVLKYVCFEGFLAIK